MNAINIEDTSHTETCIPNESDGDHKQQAKVPADLSATIRRKYLKEKVKRLPATIQNRITVLKNMQLEHLQLEIDFFEELFKLEQKYHMKHQPLYDRRKQIVAGEIDPEKEEPKWKTKEEHKDGDNVEKAFQFPKEIKLYSNDTKGIPDFWLNVFKNIEMLSNIIEEHDEPVLRNLTDIKILYDGNRSFILEFHFEKNEYFADQILTKQYSLKSTCDKDHPFDFYGLEIHKCKGCVINWENGKNVTVKSIRKDRWYKDSESTISTIKQVPTNSFFNFFNPPQIPDDNEEDIDEELQAILTTYFEIGHFLRERVIPKAVLYYTGDIVDDEIDGDSDDDDTDDEYGDDDNDDEEADDTSEASSK